MFEDPNAFDTYVYDHAEFAKKVAEFGPIGTTLPEDYKND
jgi:hypothetical protein